MVCLSNAFMVVSLVSVPIVTSELLSFTEFGNVVKPVKATQLIVEVLQLLVKEKVCCTSNLLSLQLLLSVLQFETKSYSCEVVVDVFCVAMPRGRNFGTRVPV